MPAPDPRPPHPPEADAGTPKAARAAWVVLLLALPLVVAIQQLSTIPQPQTDADAIQPPKGGPVEMNARMAARLNHHAPGSGAMLQPQINQAATTPLQRLRAAIAAGELVAHDQAADNLLALAGEIRDELADPATTDPNNGQLKAVLADVDLLADYYARLADAQESSDRAARPSPPGHAGASGRAPDPMLTDEQLDGLRQRHGFFGELVALAPRPPDDPARERVLGGGLAAAAVFLVAMGVIALAVVAGFALGVGALVMALTRGVRVRFAPPLPGGSVYLESAAVFVAAFGLLQVAQLAAAAVGSRAAAAVGLVSLPAQWLLLLCPLWPLARGVGWSRLRRDLGLTAPRGVAAEIGAGVVGYLALLPLVIAGVLVMLAIMVLLERIAPSGGGGQPVNPVMEALRTLDPLAVAMIFTLATIWAPLCEELVFRGALFRHLSARLAMPLAAAASALVFGLMHGYQGPQLIPVVVLGLNFALLRAWRGSIIAPIVGHFLNNFVVLVMVLALFSFVY